MLHTYHVIYTRQPCYWYLQCTLHIVRYSYDVMSPWLSGMYAMTDPTVNFSALSTGGCGEMHAASLGQHAHLL